MSHIQNRIWAQSFGFCAPFLFVVLLIAGCSRQQNAGSPGADRELRLIEKGRRLEKGKTAVAKIRILGAPSPQIEKELLSGIATRESTSFLWSRRYEAFSKTALKKDLNRIVRGMRRRGYYEARVLAARVSLRKEAQGNRPAQLGIVVEIEAGAPVVIRRIETTGLAQLEFAAAQAAVADNPLRVGQIFDERAFEGAKSSLATSLANRGYAYARVSGTAQVDLAARSAHVTIRAKPGRRATLGEVKIAGLARLDEPAVRRVLRLRRGARYSHTALQEARAALFSLGTFTRVEVLVDLEDESKSEVPVLIRLEEAPLRDVTVGAGVRLDLLRLAAVAQGSWTHRNFLGGLRKLRLSTRPGLTFFPTSADNIEAPTSTLPENFATVRLEQPSFPEARTLSFVESGYNIYPVLYPLPEGSNPRDERVIGYHELTTSVGASRSFFNRKLFAQLSLNWQANFPFAYQNGEADSDLIKVQVTYPELLTNIDLRDDPLQPTKGAYFSNSLQLALPLHPDDPTDIRLHPELRTFIPLDRKHRLVLATRFGIGMVFPYNYGQTLTDAGEEFAVDLSDREYLKDQQKLLFRAFYSGGPGSNRGYPFRRIGPQGAIGFLLPRGEDCSGPLNSLEASCIRPIGGFSLWEASTELRFRALTHWSFVGFIDASDVSTQIAHFTLRKPHISVGPGVRYLSPVGPIRLDIGWRVPGLQKLKDVSDEPQDTADVPPYSDQGVLQRFSLQILIGEDF